MLVEVGPGKALTQMARQHVRRDTENAFFTTLTQPEPDHMGVLLGQLWLGGAPIRWPAFYSREQRRRVPLPTYPFERQRYWIEPTKRVTDSRAITTVAKLQPMEPSGADISITDLAGSDSAVTQPAQFHPRPNLKTPYVPPSTELEKSIAQICTKVLGITEIGVDDVFFDFGVDSFMALQVVAGLKRDLDLTVPVVTLYENLTIRSLAAMLQSAREGNEASWQPVELETYRQNRVARGKLYQQKERIRRIGA